MNPRNPNTNWRLAAMAALLFSPFAATPAKAEPPVALDNGLVAHFAFENNLFATGIGGGRGRPWAM